MFGTTTFSSSSIKVTGNPVYTKALENIFKERPRWELDKANGTLTSVGLTEMTLALHDASDSDDAIITIRCNGATHGTFGVYPKVFEELYGFVGVTSIISGREIPSEVELDEDFLF